MTVLVIQLIFGLTVGALGVIVGWIIRSIFSKNTVSGSMMENRYAKEALRQVQILAEQVANDVGIHNTRVTAISEELTTSSDTKTNVVISAVQKLIQANETMQRQLESAETRLQEQARELETQAANAMTDVLTGLPNRRALDLNIQRRFKESRDSGVPLSMVMFDVDHFKRFNDMHGHQAGDEVLRGVGELLNGQVGENVLPARYGGEEFSIVVCRADQMATCRLAETIRSLLEAEPFRFEGQELRVTASFGVAQLGESEEAEQWLARADEALYTAKRNGRNRTYRHDGFESVPYDPKGTRKETTRETSAPPVKTVPVSGPAPAPAAKPQLVAVRPSALLANRTTFCETIHRRIAESIRGGPTVSVVLIRLDKFDEIARERGPQAAALVVEATTQFLIATMRKMDMIAQYDDLTFGLMLPTANLENAIGIAERLRDATARCRLPLGDGELVFTVSLGVAEATHADNVLTLMHRAEEALQEAIEHGPNRCWAHDGNRPYVITEIVSTTV